MATAATSVHASETVKASNSTSAREDDNALRTTGSKTATTATTDAPLTAASAEDDAATVTPAAARDAEPDDAATAAAGESSGQIVDMDVFGQLLEIDDDESHEFSKTLAFDYISQADATFQEIEEALQARDLDTLSRKGHFLKGSSAALGLQRVQRTCEQMQHVGQRKDESGESGELLSEDEALKRSRGLLERVKREQEEAKEWLEAFFKA
ncbi:hypothetical protein ACM66B_003349 [Microbotryomycetes sp. NB124-2]